MRATEREVLLAIDGARGTRIHSLRLVRERRSRATKLREGSAPPVLHRRTAERLVVRGRHLTSRTSVATSARRCAGAHFIEGAVGASRVSRIDAKRGLLVSDTPQRFDAVYTYDFAVPESAIDAFGHVNNLVYLQWVLDAAERHSTARGWDFARYQRAGAAWIVRRHEIDYLRGVRAAEALSVATWIEQYTRVTALRVTEMRDAQGRVVCACKTTWVFVSLETMRPVRISQEFFRDFGGTLATGDRAARDERS